MTLAEYLKSSGLSQSQFAARIKVPPSTVWRVLERRVDPSLKLMKKVMKATKGAVTPNDFAGMSDRSEK